MVRDTYESAGAELLYSGWFEDQGQDIARYHRHKRAIHIPCVKFLPVLVVSFCAAPRLKEPNASSVPTR